MNFRCLVLSTSLAVLVPAQAPQEVPSPTADAALLARALDRFGADLAARSGGAGNLCQSPASVGLCLLLMLPGARGETAAELRKLLCPEGWDEQRTLSAVRTLVANLHGSPTIELREVHDLWLQAGHPLLPAYLSATRTAFGAEVRPQDFVQDYMGARKRINEYVAQATGNRIQDLMPPDGVSPDTRLVLTNALYLRAAWQDRFQGCDTWEGAFHLPDGRDAQVPLMHRQGRYALAQVDGLQVLRLPYADPEFAFEIALPTSGGTLAAAEQALRPEGMAAWASALRQQEVAVTLPRFRVEGSFRLVRPLRAMGLVHATTEGEADFSGIDGGAGGLCIEQVVHKTFLDVAEGGTEAAAATAVGKRGGAASRPDATVTADHPFAFALRDLRTGMVLFAGRLCDPRAGKP